MIPKKHPAWYQGKEITIKTIDMMGITDMTFDLDEWIVARNVNGFVVFMKDDEVVSISYDYIYSARIGVKKSKLKPVA